MTHAVRIVASVAVLAALGVGAPVQAQTPEIDALRVRAEAGDAEAQYDLGVMLGRCEGSGHYPCRQADARRLQRSPPGEDGAYVWSGV